MLNRTDTFRSHRAFLEDVWCSFKCILSPPETVRSYRVLLEDLLFLQNHSKSWMDSFYACRSSCTRTTAFETMPMCIMKCYLRTIAARAIALEFRAWRLLFESRRKAREKALLWKRHNRRWLITVLLVWAGRGRPQFTLDV